MVVRNLLCRLGLEPDSPQLRFIATSASLPATAAASAYLEQFFGVAPLRFFVTAGPARRRCPSLHEARSRRRPQRACRPSRPTCPGSRGGVHRPEDAGGSEPPRPR